MSMSVSRRKILRLGGAAAAATATYGLRLAGPAQAAPDAFTLCGTWEMTGSLANTGLLCDRGSRLAVETLAPKLGLKATYVTVDTEGDPGKAVRKAGEQMSQRGTRFFVGGASSAIALAVSKEVNKAGGVYVTTGGADELTGSECTKATFRWPVATFGAVEQTVRPLRQRLPNAKRWYTLTPKYVFGEALLRNVRRVLGETGAELVGNAYHGLGDREFSGYLTEAQAARPDVLCLLSFSGQTADTLRQAVDFGLKTSTTVLVVWSAGLDQYRAIGADVLDGVYLGAQYWHELDTPQNSELVPLFRKAFGGPPTYSEISGYMLARLILEGVAKAQSTDSRQVIGALEGLRYEGPTGPEEVRAADHQCLKNYYLLKGKPAKAMRSPDDFVEILSAGKSFPPPAETGCKAI
ncbi:MAG: ABC transporter substrate-binding protein [Hyphomonadaceae bacterium]|nr:ABC transporter substrate-binding protein [Hyphomonadaceae bacterium]